MPRVYQESPLNASSALKAGGSSIFDDDDLKVVHTNKVYKKKCVCVFSFTVWLIF